MKQYRIARGNDDKYYPQYKGWFLWHYFKRCVQYEIVERVSFHTHKGASDYLQAEFEGENKTVKFKQCYLIPWEPKCKS